MKFTELELIDLNVDDSTNKDIFVNFDSNLLYGNDSSNTYLAATAYSTQEDHQNIINDARSNFESMSFGSQIDQVNHVSEAANSDPILAEIGWNGILEPAAPAGVSTPGSSPFMLTEHWGHEYVSDQSATYSNYYFADVEKHASSDAGDDLLCWAAAASNLLQWSGWANGVDDSISTEQDVLDYYASHWTDDGGWTDVAWQWWFTGEEAAWAAEADSAHVDVEGAGFFPTITVNDNTIAANATEIDTAQRDNGLTYTFDIYWDFIVEHMDAGYGVYLGLSFGSNMGHAITAWGYEETDGIKYLYYSDSDDGRSVSGGAAAAPNVLKRTRFTLETSQFFDPDFAPNGIYVLNDYGPRTELDQISAIKQFDSDMIGVAEGFADAKEVALVFSAESRRGNVDIAGDKDYYFINVTSAGYINILISAVTYANTDFSIYDSNETLLAEISGSESSYGLTADIGRYYIVVEGDSLVSRGSATDNTYLISFVQDDLVPGIPENLSRIITGDDVALDWSDVIDGSGIKNYQVQVANDEGFENLVEDQAFTVSDGTFNDMVDGSYFWRVRAIDNAENVGDWSVVKNFVVDTIAPDVPSNLSDDGDDLPDAPGGNYLSWDVSTDLNGIRWYVVEYADNADLNDSITVNMRDNKIAVSDMPGIMTYHWRVKAVDNYGNESEFTEVIESDIPDDVAPSALAGLRRSSDEFIWNVSTDDRSGLKEYVIEYAENSDWSDVQTKTVSTNQVSIADLNMSARTYYWRVKAVDNSGNETYSVTKRFTLGESDNEISPPAVSGHTNIGSSVAMSGDNIAVNVDDAESLCKVHVYRWNETVYYEHILEGTSSGSFLLMSGSNVVVGGENDDTNGSDAGAMEVHYWNGETYEKHTLSALDGMQNDNMGRTVSISGNNVVAGVVGDDDNGLNSGSAYVFRKYETSYEEYKLTASDGSRHDAFGSSVSISGDKVFVGAYKDDDNGEDSGSLFIYNWNGDFYAETAKLTASDAAAGDNFGVSLSSEGNNIVVGADKDDDEGIDSGSAYVYRWNEETLSYNEYKLTASDGSTGDNFGNFVSISGDYVAVGAYRDDDNGEDSGSVYIYQWDGDGYDEIKKIIASDGDIGRKFGSTVSISGDNLIVGTEYASGGSAYIYSLNSEADSPNNPVFRINDPDTTLPSDITASSQSMNWRRITLDWEDAVDNKVVALEYIVEFANNASFTGAVSVTVNESELVADNFAGNSTYHWRVKARDVLGNLSAEWSIGETFDTFTTVAAETRMTAQNGAAGEYFGSSVSAFGNNRLVGSYGEDGTGSAYVYRENGGEYSEYKLTAVDGAAEDFFGATVAMSGDNVLVGAYGDDTLTGSAYVYKWNGTDDYAAVKLTASDSDTNDYFGSSVAISGDHVAVKAEAGNKAYVYRWEDGDYVEYKLDLSVIGATPAGQVPAGQAPAEQSLVGQGTVEQILTEEAPVEESPVGQVPVGLQAPPVGASPDELAGVNVATEVPLNNPNKLMSQTNDAVILAGETLSLTIGEGFTIGNDTALSFDGTGLTFTISGDLITDIYPDRYAYGVAFYGENGKFNMSADSTYTAEYTGTYGEITYAAIYSNGELFSDGLGGDIIVDAESNTVYGIKADKIDFSEGNISGNISVNMDHTYFDSIYDYRNVYGIKSVDYFIAANISGTITASGTITNDIRDYAYIHTRAVSASSITTGEISGTLSAISSATETDNYSEASSYVFESYNDMSLGNISGVVSSESSATGTTGMAHSYSTAFYSLGNMGTGDISGSISAVSSAQDAIGHITSTSRAFYASGNMSLGDISGTISSTSSATGTVDFSESNSYALSASGDINCEYISGTITASSTNVSSSSIAKGIDAAGDVIIDEISGSITATGTVSLLRYGATASAIEGNVVSGVDGAALVITEAAAITAVANGNYFSVADGISATSGMNLDIYGTVSASGFNASGTYRSLYSSGDFADTVVLRSTANITGDIALNGGDDELSIELGALIYGDIQMGTGNDSLIFTSGDINTGQIYVFGDITSTEELMVDFDILGLDEGSTLLNVDSSGFGTSLSITVDTADQNIGAYVLIDSSAGINDFYDGKSFSVNGDQNLTVGGGSVIVDYRVMRLDVVDDTQLVLNVSEINLGDSIGISGNYVAVGEKYNSINAIDSGSVNVYHWHENDYNLMTSLSASDAAAFDVFGYSVVISGSTVVAGAIGDDDKGADSGSAYVYRWNQGTSSYDEYKLTASDGAAGDSFGSSVEISGDYIIIGAKNDDNDNGVDSGSIYIYQWTGSEYNQIKKMFASDGVAGDNYGVSVSLAGNNLLVGTKSGSTGDSAYSYLVNEIEVVSEVADEIAPSIVSDMTNSAERDSAQLNWAGFDNNPGFIEYTVEYADNASFTDATSITLYDNTLAISDLEQGSSYYWRVKSKDDAGNESTWGKTETFTIDTFLLSETTKLTASDGVAHDRFGNAVSISGENIVIGAKDDGDDDTLRVGSAHVYRKNGDSYDEYKLTALDGAENDYFGVEVSISGDNVIVGSYGDDIDGGDDTFAGSAYIYRWDDEKKLYDEYKLTASDIAENDHFGISVSISGDDAVVGSYANDGIGSAYVYKWNGNSYDEYKLVDSDGFVNDDFGCSVSISDGHVVVGSCWDDGGDNSSGSAYVYRWDAEEELYDEYKLIASDGESSDQFGYSVSISGNNVVVGAYWDDDSGTSSGSAYVYRWNGSSYDEYKLTASDGTEFDLFGSSVSISGDYVVVGAHQDDVGGVFNSGSAYIYHWNGSSYDEFKKLVASDGTSTDYFGYSVSISDMTVTVGSSQSDGNNFYSGSAYVYEINEFDNTAPSDIDGMSGAATSTSVVLDWDDSTDANPIEYIVQYADNESLNSSTTLIVTESELALSNLDTGSSYYWRAKARDDAGNASDWSVTKAFTTLRESSTPACVASDFDGNGDSDILWHNQSNGTTGVWSGADISDWRVFGEIAVDWEIVGIGDFDANNSSDILWQNKIDGTVAIWENASDWQEKAAVSRTDWEIVGVGDFNGNNSSDILWQNITDGTIGVWESGSNWEQGAKVSRDVWEIAGAGDFSGDGKDDILWRNRDDGSVGMWGDGLSSNWRGDNGSADINAWKIVGIGDFNCDGKDDVLWRNQLDGTVGMWGDGLNTNWREIGRADINWKIVGVGDFNGNGSSDILWQNENDNSVGMWESATDWQGLGGVSSDDWKVCIA